MARFDIYPNPIAEDRPEFPFVLQIQSDLLYQFTERVCVPLVRPQAVPGLTERFNPTIEVAGESLRLHPLGISVFYVDELRVSIASAQARGLDIETALDMLLRGY
ncbi:CcdB family protein [Polaromonas sp.]|uniref:CcdB family protein n=1 Tax=Polaromonas sp. TaxID=1869339 RepID=UPI002FC68BB6